MKLPMGRFGFFEPAARPAQRVGHGRDRLVLADDALVQLLFHAQQLGRLALQHRVDRDAGPAGDDRGDVRRFDHLVQACSPAARRRARRRIALAIFSRSLLSSAARS